MVDPHEPPHKPPHETLDRTPMPLACPMCGYSRFGLVDAGCPECGHVLTADEAAHAYRWQVFLEVTRGTVVARWGAMMVLAVASLLLRDYRGSGVPTVICILGGVCLATALGGSRFVSGVGVRGRTLRRMWMLAAVWAQALWIGPLVVVFLHSMTGGFGFLFRGWRDELSFRTGTRLFAVAGLAGVLLGVFAFRRLCRLVRITPTAPERVSLSEGMKLAVAPLFLIVVGVVLSELFVVLDRVRPSWWG